MSLLTEDIKLIQENITATQSEQETDVNLKQQTEVEETKGEKSNLIVKQGNNKGNKTLWSEEHIMAATSLLCVIFLAILGPLGFQNYKSSRTNRQLQQNQYTAPNNNHNTETRPEKTYVGNVEANSSKTLFNLKNNYNYYKSAGQIIDEDLVSKKSDNSNNNIDVRRNLTIIHKHGRWKTVKSIVNNLKKIPNKKILIVNYKNDKWKAIKSMASRIKGIYFGVQDGVKKVKKDYKEHLDRIAENERKELEKLEKIPLKNIAEQMQVDIGSTEKSKLKEPRTAINPFIALREKRSMEVKKPLYLQKAKQLEKDKKDWLPKAEKLPIVDEIKTDQIDSKSSTIEAPKYWPNDVEI